MRATTLFVAALLLSACGASPAPLAPLATRAAAPESLGALAKKASPASCVTKSLEWGDKDGDGLLSQDEFVDLTLIALDGTARYERDKIEDLGKKKRKIEQLLAENPDDEGLKAKLAACDEQREQAERRLEKIAKERVTAAKASEKKFKAYDTDRSGAIDRGELLDACRAASKE